MFCFTMSIYYCCVCCILLADVATRVAGFIEDCPKMENMEDMIAVFAMIVAKKKANGKPYYPYQSILDLVHEAVSTTLFPAFFYLFVH